MAESVASVLVSSASAITVTLLAVEIMLLRHGHFSSQRANLIFHEIKHSSYSPLRVHCRLLGYYASTITHRERKRSCYSGIDPCYLTGMSPPRALALMRPPRARGRFLLGRSPPPARTVTSMVSPWLCWEIGSLSCSGAPRRVRRRCCSGMPSLPIELVRKVFNGVIMLPYTYARL